MRSNQSKGKVTRTLCIFSFAVPEKQEFIKMKTRPQFKGRLFGKEAAGRIDISELARTSPRSAAALSKNDSLPKAASA